MTIRTFDEQLDDFIVRRKGMKVKIEFRDLPTAGCNRCKYFETYTLEEKKNMQKNAVDSGCRYAELCGTAIRLYKEDMEKMLTMDGTTND